MNAVPRPRVTTPLLGTILYIVFVVVILVVPTNPPHPRRGYLAEYQRLVGRRLMADVVLNITIFAPIGWGLVRTVRSLGASPPGLVPLVAVAAGLFSLLMETVQFWLPARYSSALDVAANTLGALLGAWAAARYGSRV
jgi:glycopeptide antibiotics resistance protein